MTREVDSLIAFNATLDSGAYAGYITNGQHAVNSFHGRVGTPSASGPIGLAVDFDAIKNDPNKLLICARGFFGVASSLAELFYTPLGVWVKYGKVYPIATLDPHDRELHNNHVHVALAKGTFLTPPIAVIPTTPPQPTEDGMADALVIQYPDGSKTIVGADGAVFNAGTPFFGSMYDLKPEQKLGVTSIKAATAVSYQDPGAGYCLWSQTGNRYVFNPALWKSLGH